MKRTILALTAALGLSGVATAGTTYVPKVSEQAARATALETVPGKVIDHDLEKEDGRWVHQFEIHPAGENKVAVIRQVTVDADSGQVISVETENR
jgi:uncharacterized membrane protein YkoI